MKWTALVLAVTALATSACASLPYREDRYLYASDRTAYGIEQVEDALDAAAQRGRPIVLFVHGRGAEPEKSLNGTGGLTQVFVEGRAVHKLEAYDASVLLVSWDSKRGGFGPFGIRDRTRPLGNTPAGGAKLREVLHRVSAWADQNPSRPPVSLLAHSMGTIVLEECVRAGGWPERSTPLFRNVILCSADADNLGHAKWVEDIPATERVYVTVNPGDEILRDSSEGRQQLARALGLDPGTPLASNATYVALHADAKKAERFGPHEVFHKCSCRGHAQVVRFFRVVLRGETPDLGAGARPGSVARLEDDVTSDGPLFDGCTH
jgi:esterase/lipase superfamily enzyme